MLVLWVTLDLLLVLSSCNWTPARGQTCSIPAAQFSLHTVTVSAESVTVGTESVIDGSAPGVRVTWSTTVPPECVTSYRVEFRNNGSHGPVVAHYTTTNSSQTEVIQNGLQCRTDYYINVVVTGETSDGIQPMLNSRQVQVLVGEFDVPHPLGVRAEVTADNTSIRVSWQWSHQGVPMCVDLVRVHYQPEGGSVMMYTVGSTTAATSATLPDLQCNTAYTIWVYASGGSNDTWSAPIIVFLPARGLQNLSAAVLSPTSVHLAWLAPYHTQQSHIYYKGTCGAYVDEDRLNTDHLDHTFNKLQEGTNYTFIVNQTGGGRVLLTGPVYAKTFTAVPSGAPESLEGMFVQPTKVERGTLHS